MCGDGGGGGGDSSPSIGACEAGFVQAGSVYGEVIGYGLTKSVWGGKGGSIAGAAIGGYLGSSFCESSPGSSNTTLNPDDWP